MKIEYTYSNGIPQKEIACAECGTKFFKNTRKIKMSKHNFCSNNCKFAYFKSKPRNIHSYRKNSVLELIKLKRESQSQRNQCHKG